MLQQWNTKHKKKWTTEKAASKQSIRILLNNPADSGDKPVQFVNQLYEDTHTAFFSATIPKGKLWNPESVNFLAKFQMN